MPAFAEATHYGYRSRLVDPVTRSDLRAWAAGVRRIVGDQTSFCQLQDLRSVERISGDPLMEAIVNELRRHLRAHGLRRSAVVVLSTRVAGQTQALGYSTQVWEWERYFDGADPDWERSALAWLVHGKEPAPLRAAKPSARQH